MLLERQFIYHCAPTLASLKTANMFTLRHKNVEDILNEIESWNSRFTDKCIRVELLSYKNEIALIYVYRPDFLKKDMSSEEAKLILKMYGYTIDCIEKNISTLKLRLKKNDEFPHEIGLFLGYPIEDILGFICNKGKNCNLCGYWKVYGDTSAALSAFAKFDKCKDVYQKLWNEGRNIMKLTVA